MSILLISNMLMEEERTWNAGKTINWATGSKTSVKFTASSCGMRIHRRLQSASQLLKTLYFAGQLKTGMKVKVPYTRKTKYQMTNIGNIRLYIVHYGKWIYPNNNYVLAPEFLKISLYNVKAKKWSSRLFFVPGT